MSIRPGELERSRKVYQQLGLQDFAPFDEVKRRYRELAMLFHPDSAKASAPNGDTERFVLINEAYQILSDETRRARYDSALKSAQAAAAVTGLPSAYNVPGAAAPSRAHHFQRDSSSYSDPTMRNPLSSPVDSSFNTRSHFNSRHPRTASSNNRRSASSSFGNPAGGGLGSPTNNNHSANTPTTAYASSGGQAPPSYYSQDQNEEFKKREKQRFAEMKRRLESERNAVVEQERQRVMKQQTEQRREKQRREREQERLRERLDKALLSGTSSKQQQQPIVRSASSANQPSVSFAGGANNSNARSASAVGRQASNLPTSNITTTASTAQFLSSPKRTFGSPIAAHTFEKQATFASSGRGPRAGLQGIAASPPPKGTLTDDEDENEPPEREQRNNDGASPAGTPTKQQLKSMFNSSPAKKIYGSPEIAAIALQQIEKDLAALPAEEEEERDHFLRLQERHERTTLVSVFKQRAVEIEAEIYFRAFLDDEEDKRYDVEAEQVRQFSFLTVEVQSRMSMERLLRESQRNLHGLLAWHENVWTHLKQKVSRLFLLGEREQLARSAVVEAEEEKDAAKLAVYGAMLNRKFRVGAADETTARQELYQSFYGGARAIAASRSFLARREPIYREERDARVLLGIELQEILYRGKIAQDRGEVLADITEQRTHAMARYITSLTSLIAEQKVKLTNHDLIVANMQQQMDHQKQAHVLESGELESRLMMLRGDMLGLETTVARLKEAAHNAEDAQKLAEEKAADAMQKREAAEQQLEETKRELNALADRRVAEAQKEAAQAKEAGAKALADEKKDHDKLREKHEKLSGKFMQASEMLTEMAEKEDLQRQELEQLRKEVTALRLQQIDAAEGSPTARNQQQQQQQQQQNRQASSVSPMSASPSHSPPHQHPRSGITNQQQTSSSGLQTPVPQTPTKNQTSGQKFPPSSPTQGAKNKQQQQPPLSAAGRKQAVPAAAASPGSKKMMQTTPTGGGRHQPPLPSHRSVSQTPPDQTPYDDQMEALHRQQHGTMSFDPEEQQEQYEQQEQLPLENAEESLVARHARTARLEHRLYTAAAAASAASIAIAQRESTKTPRAITSPAALPKNANDTSSTASSAGVSPIGAAARRQQQNQQQGSAAAATTTPASIARTPQSQLQQTKQRTPLSTAGGKSATLSSSSSPPAAGGNNSSTNNRSSYRELSTAAHGRSVKQITEFEADDAAAVAQRDAVASFLQRQNAPGAFGYTDDPRQAPMSVKAPVPGRGILEYAGIKKSAAGESHQQHDDSSSAAAADTSSNRDGCSTCDMNDEAMNKLVSTTDKLLARNAALVDDNALLAQAVVAMNKQRQHDAAAGGATPAAAVAPPPPAAAATSASSASASASASAGSSSASTPQKSQQKPQPKHQSTTTTTTTTTTTAAATKG